jgi:CHAT domain-containing protein
MSEHEQAEADIRRQDPRYAALVHPATLPVDVLQKEVLDSDTVLLAYSLGRSRSFVWAVTNDRVLLAALPGRAIVEGRARRFVQLAGSAPDPTHPTDAAALNSAGSGLARTILLPVADAIGRRRLLLVADGAIHQVPFAALPGPHDRSPLSARHEIVVLPSATMLAFIRREIGNRAPAPKLLAVLADPVFDRADPRVKAGRASAEAVRLDVERRRLVRLPHSRLEADRIMALVPPQLGLEAVDFDANRALATSSTIAQYRFVHFATHALQDNRHPELSGILLSMVAPNGAPQDGFLRLHDVYNLRLQADLVVLSACETGRGDERPGEGLTSLARGIFHAGAARVVSTLWKVDDEAAATFMQLFYKAMLGPAKLRPAAALRAAQSTMRGLKRWAKPYYWSGFVLQGDW